MLHFVLFLLKIIGILLGSLLGLLLILISIVLFVPIYYRLDAEKYAKINGKLKATWLLRIVTFQATYADDEEFRIKLKIFGKIIFDNLNPKPKKAKKKKKDKVKKKKEKGKTIRKEGALKEKEQRKAENVIWKAKEELHEAKENIKEEVKDDIVNGNEHDIHEVKTIIKEEANEIPNANWKKIIDEDNLGVRKIEDRSLFSKIKFFLGKLKGIFKRWKVKIQRVKAIFTSLGDIISGLISKWHLIKDFLKDETNQEGIKKSFHAIKKILKHLLPRRVKADIEFGTGDPCSTGQILGAVACFWGLFKNSIEITPNFYEEIFEGKITAKGKIRIVTLLVIVVKLIGNESFKELRSNFETLKEDL